MCENINNMTMARKEMEFVQQQMANCSVNYSTEQDEACQWIDTDIKMLTSRKLCEVLFLSQIKGCELDSEFIYEINAELKLRGDVTTWKKPH
jgi:hypothetical protein